MPSRNEKNGVAAGIRGFRCATGTVAVLLASLTLAACASKQAGPVDAYLSVDYHHASQANLRAVDGSHLGTLPVEEVNAVDLRGTDSDTCMVDTDNVVWHSASPASSPDAHIRVPHDSMSADPITDRPIATIRADRHGQCLFPSGAAELGVLSAQKPSGTRVTVGDGNFGWSSIDYVPATDTTALAGTDQFAVVRDVAHAGHVATVKVHGTVQGLTIDNLLCCAKLSPDGKTLYSMAEAGDEDHTSHTVLAAFDVATGAFKRFYLPYFIDLPDCTRISDGDQRADCEKDARFPSLSFYSGKSIELEGGAWQAFDLSPDGKTLYVEAITNVEPENGDNEQSQIIAVDVASGKATPLPIAAYGTFAVSASGKYLFVGDADTLAGEYAKGIANHDQPVAKADERKPVQVYSLPLGQWVRDLPGDKLIGAVKNLPQVQ
jgi:hypothetical protein